MKLKNKYYIVRHGQAVSNVKEIMSCWPEKFHNPVTQVGRKMVKQSAQKLKSKNINMIFASPLLRTKITSEIVGKALGVTPKTDMRLKEQDVGIYNGRPYQDTSDFFGEKTPKRFKLKPKGGEVFIDIKKRMEGFIKAIDKKYKNKTILVISHELPLIWLDCVVKGIANKDFYTKRKKIKPAEFRALN